jgi:hypothetical protein
MLILALVLSGLGNLFVVARSYLKHSKARIAAAEAGNFVLSPLQCAVRDDTFDSGDLAVTSPTRIGDSITSDSIIYNSTFAIQNVSGLPAGGLLRKVTTTIQWNETDL